MSTIKRAFDEAYRHLGEFEVKGSTFYKHIKKRMARKKDKLKPLKRKDFKRLKNFSDYWEIPMNFPDILVCIVEEARELTEKHYTHRLTGKNGDTITLMDYALAETIRMLNWCVNLYTTNSLEGIGMFKYQFQAKMERAIDKTIKRNNELISITTIPYNKISLNK